MAWERGNSKSAYRQFLAGALKGDESCQLNVGYLLDEGIGVKKNKQKALSWYRKAHNQGVSSATTNIGIWYREQKNNRRAVQWFKKAVALGDQDALYELGCHYQQGLGVRKKRKTAIQFFRKVLRSKNVTEATKEQAASALLEMET